MRTYYAKVTYKATHPSERDTVNCYEIDSDLARELVKNAGKKLTHVTDRGIEVERHNERGMTVITVVATMPTRAYMDAMPNYYREFDERLTDAERAEAAEWREYCEAVDEAVKAGNQELAHALVEAHNARKKIKTA